MSRFLARVLAFLSTTIASLILPAQEPQSKPAPRPFAIDADGSVTIRGKVVLFDREGQAREKVSGTASIVAWCGDSGAHEAVEITDGEWEATFTAEQLTGPAAKFHAVSISDWRFDLPAALLSPMQIQVAGAVEFVFRFREPRELRLRVLDAVNKQELDQVDLYRNRSSRSRGGIHPGRNEALEPLATAAKSPLVVPPPQDLRDTVSNLWLRAPNHAWHRLEVFEARSGTVQMIAAGALQVTVVGKLPPPQLPVVLRLYPPVGEFVPLAEFPVTSNRLDKIDGLAPGRYMAHVELGEWFRSPQRLANQDLVIRAGETTELELTIEREVTLPRKVQVKGTLVLAPAWLHESGPELQFEPMEETERVGGDRIYVRTNEFAPGKQAGEYQFTLSGVVSGSYQAIIQPSDHRVVVSLGSPEPSELRIEAPLPAEVMVRVIDGATGRPKQGVQLSWLTPTPGRVAGPSPKACYQTSETGVVQFLAPVGKIFVSDHDFDDSSHSAFQFAQRTFDVRLGKNEFEVKTVPMSGIRVGLYDGPTKIPMDSRWDVSLAPMEGQHRGSMKRGRGTLFVETPGRYRLMVIGPDDYEPVAERQVVLSPGPSPEIEIQLVRRR